jgi:cytochrome c-type biogenesis protein CcmH
VVKANPTDPRPRLFLARAQAASGDLASAVQTLRTATRVAPNESAIWASLGEALVQQANGSETADAQTAFRRTIALDPKALSARYHLARAKVMNGDVAGGVADWRSLAAALPPGDPAAVALLDQADRTAKAGRLVEIDQGDGAQTRTAQTQAAQVAPSPAEGGPNADQVQAQARAMQGQAPADQKAFIQTMVDRLAAKLKADPQDFQGWARLIRAYGVLGDTAKQTAARARAEALFKGNPQAMQAVRDAAAPPGALGR